MISLLLLALPAFAADPAPEATPAAPAPVLVRLDPPSEPKVTLQLGIGTQRVPHSSFAPNGGRTTASLSGRYHLTKWLGVDVALVHARTGGNREFYNDSDDYYADEDYYAESVHTSLLTERLDVGVSVEVPVTVWFHPFARVAAVGAINVARLDEDTSDPTNLNQLSQVGFDGGGYVGGGLAFPIPVRHQVRLVPSLEVGYSGLTPVGLGDMGSLADSGLTARFAWGVSF